MKFIKFIGNNCPACDRAEPILERVLPKFNIDIEKISIETEEGIDIAQKYRVMGLPTLILVDDSDEVIANIRHMFDDDDLFEEISESFI